MNNVLPIVVGDRRQLAVLLERHVSEALHPKTLACYLESGDGRLVAISGTLPATLETLSASEPGLVELARRGKAWEVPSGSAGAEELTALAPLAPECLVPILGRENNLIGMLVLGQRLSEPLKHQHANVARLQSAVGGDM